ncbi:two component transcriptional regulator, LuxR family [Paenibacillus algorifonticola]|uniref:Two component transcriptional regulator, LuxR family n=1 Tax=Paenibacillus algorifonticola TaxID=684063 RepID=A0A1I2F682_9BACL|nr:response regulator transcription factor [Paenibacillus algorifonticola]SFF00503.1 two component transcriptional regulator, LuxR family [Paenibacillus algorifonticola]
MEPIRLVIADDQRLLRESLRTVIELEEDMKVVGLAENGQHACELVDELRPTLVLMDVQMPIMDGISAIRKIRARHPALPILILTTFTDDDYIIEGLAGGAIGYLLKDMDKANLLAAIRSAAAGRHMLTPEIATKLAARLSAMSKAAPREMNTHKLKRLGLQFTEREKQIIALMVQPLTNPQIADSLFMSVGTVKNYVSIIYSKLGTSDRMQAVASLQELFSVDEE